MRKNAIIRTIGITAIATAMLSACAQENQKGNSAANGNAAENAVIETIMSRRSVRAYEERAVPRDTMELIAECGINAPNGMNKQEWEIRIVDNPEFINAQSGKRARRSLR